jgi:hypothetical protein
MVWEEEGFDLFVEGGLASVVEAEEDDRILWKGSLEPCKFMVRSAVMELTLFASC